MKWTFSFLTSQIPALTSEWTDQVKIWTLFANQDVILQELNVFFFTFFLHFNLHWVGLPLISFLAPLQVFAFKNSLTWKLCNHNWPHRGEKQHLESCWTFFISLQCLKNFVNSSCRIRMAPLQHSFTSSPLTPNPHSQHYPSTFRSATMGSLQICETMRNATTSTDEAAKTTRSFPPLIRAISLFSCSAHGFIVWLGLTAPLMAAAL